MVFKRQDDFVSFVFTGIFSSIPLAFILTLFKPQLWKVAKKEPQVLPWWEGLQATCTSESRLCMYGTKFYFTDA